MRRVDTWVAAAAVVCAGQFSTLARAQVDPDGGRSLATLFRAEIGTAGRIAGRSASGLSDEARLAIAVSGLSWEPVSGGIALLRREKRSVAYSAADERNRGYVQAVRQGEERTAIAFALSVALSPPEGGEAPWREACRYLDRYGADIDRVLAGVLDAPESLPLLPGLQYAAIDVLAARASPSLLSLFAALAQSGDTYIRSRAVASLGVLCYRPSHRGGDTRLALLRTPRAHSISATQQRMFDEVFRRASEDRSYRVRAAAALALGLRADAADAPALERLAKDRAYLSEQVGARGTKRILFPVRAEAARALARLGRDASATIEGTFSGRELRSVVRGGQDVTKDRSGMRHDRPSHVPFSDGSW